MSEVFDIPANIASRCLINPKQYDAMYKQSIEEPDVFWSEQAATFLAWTKPWEHVSQVDMQQGQIAWFNGGELNVSTNCIDRHLPARADQTAIIWEGDEPTEESHITYQQLYERVCQLANGLRERGVKKGDRVCIYMPMIPEAAYAMLACARIGAIHSVVFGGFPHNRCKIEYSTPIVGPSSRLTRVYAEAVSSHSKRMLMRL